MNKEKDLTKMTERELNEYMLTLALSSTNNKEEIRRVGAYLRQSKQKEVE